MEDQDGQSTPPSFLSSQPPPGRIRCHTSGMHPGKDRDSCIAGGSPSSKPLSFMDWVLPLSTSQGSTPQRRLVQGRGDHSVLCCLGWLELPPSPRLWESLLSAQHLQPANILPPLLFSPVFLELIKLLNSKGEQVHNKTFFLRKADLKFAWNVCKQPN